MDRPYRRTVVLAVLGLLVLTAGCVGTAEPTDDVSTDGPVSTATDTRTATNAPTATDGADAPAATPTNTAEASSVGSATTTVGTTEQTSSTGSETPGTTATTDAGTAAGQEWTVTVVRVVDGDTLTVRFPEGYEENVRLLGVDTPEVHVENDPAEFEGLPDTAAGNEWLRDWGHRGSEFARAELGGETVRIAVDPVADRRGSYGRLLVYVYHDGGVFNRQLLDQGYARVYDSRFSERSTYDAIEREAQANRIGLWGFDGTVPDPTATATPRDGESGPVVSAIQADAPGNDHENLNEEYVTFENTGKSPIDLGGWQVSDAADHSYTFPEGFVLDPGESVRLNTGAGSDSGSERYWGSNGAIWNNGGDVIVVTDDAGREVLRREYP